MRTFIITFLLSVTLPLATTAAIYKFVDENGNTVFADQPGPNSVEIEKRDIQTIKTQKARPTTKLTNPNNTQSNTTALYSEFKISKPTNDENIRANTGEIQVDLLLSPALNQKLGHKVVLFLNGKKVAEPGTETKFTLHNVDRGQHSLSAKVVDSSGTVITTTDTVTIHIKRYSLLLDPRTSAEPTGDSDSSDNTDSDETESTGVKRAPMAPSAPMAPKAPQA